jgi:hypothetical protein
LFRFAGCFFWRLEPKTRFFERKNVDKTWSIVWWLWFFRWLFVVELWFEEAAVGQTIYEPSRNSPIHGIPSEFTNQKPGTQRKALTGRLAE